MIPSTTTDIPRARLVPETTDIPKARLVPMSKDEERDFLGAIDQRTGAPLNLRAAVAAVRRPAQKLAILRRVDPAAQPTEDGNFVYTPPGATGPILFDPKPNPFAEGGLSAREVGKDIVEALPFVAELGGGVFGGVTGAVSGVPGAMLGAGLGASGARGTVENVMLGMTGTEDPRSTAERAIDVGSSALANMLGEGLGRFVQPIGRAAASRMAGSPAAIATREAAARLSVPLTAGMATGRKFLQNVESALASYPATVGVMSDAYERATKAATTAANRIVGDIARGGSTSPANFASALQGAANASIQKFKTTRLAMDKAIDEIIPSDAMASVNNVQRVYESLQQAMEQAPASLAPSYKPAMDQAERILQDAAANGGNIPFGVLRQLRTTVGEAAKWGGLTGERVPGSQRHLRDVYFALRDDILGAANTIDEQAMAAGLPSPGAAQAIQLHDEFVRLANAKENPASLRTLGKLVEASPQEPAQWANALVKDPRKAVALRKAIDPREWDTLAGSVFEDMGRARPGVQSADGELWSPSTFLTNWNKLGPAGRRAMFGGTRYAAVADDVTALARVAEAMRNSASLANRSNTARALLVPMMLGSVGAGVGAVVGGGEGAVRGFGMGGGLGGAALLSTYAASKLLTSPRVLSVIRSGVVGTARNAPSVLARLAAIAKTDETLREPINEYIAAVGAAGFPVPSMDSVVQLNAQSPGVQYEPR